MAIRLDVLRFNVRANLGDLNLQPPAVPSYTMDQAISRQMQTLVGRLGHPAQWNTSWLSLVANDNEYTVTPSVSAEFHAAVLFRLASTGRLIEKVSAEYFERAREGVTSSSGEVQIVTLLETLEAAGTPRKLTVRVYPTPGATDTLQALVSEMPATVSGDSDGIPLSELGGRALELLASSELLDRMSPETAAKLGIDKGVSAVWRDAGQNAVIDERHRMARLQRGRQLNRSIPY